jgi:hypothetical protein
MSSRIRTDVSSFVEHAAGGSLAAELVVNRCDRIDMIANDLPLRRCGHRRLEIALQPISRWSGMPAP